MALIIAVIRITYFEFIYGSFKLHGLLAISLDHSGINPISALCLPGATKPATMSSTEVTRAPTDHSVPWYQPGLPKPLPEPIRDLLENYSKVPPGEVESHILAVVRILLRFSHRML